MSIIKLFYKKVTAQPWTGGYEEKYLEMLDNYIQYLQSGETEINKVNQINKDVNTTLDLFPKIPLNIKNKLSEVQNLSHEILSKMGDRSGGHRALVANFSNITNKLTQDVDLLIQQNSIEELKNKTNEVSKFINKGMALLNTIPELKTEGKLRTNFLISLNFLRIAYEKAIQKTEETQKIPQMPAPIEEYQSRQTLPPQELWGASETSIIQSQRSPRLNVCPICYEKSNYKSDVKTLIDNRVNYVHQNHWNELIEKLGEPDQKRYKGQSVPSFNTSEIKELKEEKPGEYIAPPEEFALELEGEDPKRERGGVVPKKLREQWEEERFEKDYPLVELDLPAKKPKPILGPVDLASLEFENVPTTCMYCDKPVEKMLWVNFQGNPVAFYYCGDQQCLAQAPGEIIM